LALHFCRTAIAKLKLINEKFEADLKMLMAEIDKTKAKPKAPIKRIDPNHKGISIVLICRIGAGGG
jgi:hypothetical protein